MIRPRSSSLSYHDNYWAYRSMSHAFTTGNTLSKLFITVLYRKAMLLWSLWDGSLIYFLGVWSSRPFHLIIDIIISNRRFHPLIADYINAIMFEFIIRHYLHWSFNQILRSLVEGWVVWVFTTHPVSLAIIINSWSFHTIRIDYAQFATKWSKIHFCSIWNANLDLKIHVFVV